jgi:hypothetical protein
MRLVCALGYGATGRTRADLGEMLRIGQAPRGYFPTARSATELPVLRHPPFIASCASRSPGPVCGNVTWAGVRLLRTGVRNLVTGAMKPVIAVDDRCHFARVVLSYIGIDVPSDNENSSN